MAKKPIKWTPKKIGLIVAAVLVVAAIGSNRNGNTDEDLRSSPQASTTAVSSASPEKQEKAPMEDAQTVPLEQAVSQVDTYVKKNYGPNYKVSNDETTATINLWPKGVGDEAFAAANGDDNSLKSWNKRASKAKKLSTDMRTKLKDAEYPGMSVVVNILNDLNKENALLTVTDGTVTYNWVDDEKKNLAAQAAQQETAQTVAPETAARNTDIIVYLPEEGDHYHNEDCRTLKDYKEPVSLAEAIDRGYTPCGVCHPPVG